MITGSTSSCSRISLITSSPLMLREEHVEDDQGVVAGTGQREALLAVVSAGDGIALGLEPALDELGDGTFVLDHQDAHGGNARRAPERGRDLLRELSSEAYGLFMALTDYPGT